MRLFYLILTLLLLNTETTFADKAADKADYDKQQASIFQNRRKQMSYDPKTKVTLTLQLDHIDGFYKAGETAIYTISLTQRKKPLEGKTVYYKIIRKGIRWAPEFHEVETDATGTFTVDVDLKTPGYAYVMAVHIVNDDGPYIKTSSGVVADPGKIVTLHKLADDFDDFWAAKKKVLKALPMQPKLTPIKDESKFASTLDDVDLFDVQLNCIGAPVSGYYARPKDAKAKSCPAILFPQPAGVYSCNYWKVATAAKRGLIALEINAHGIANGKDAAFYKRLSIGKLANYYMRNAENRDKAYFNGIYLRLIRAMNWLCQQPEWDGTVLIVYGVSQAGNQAIAAAGLDKRVSMFVAAFPTGCDGSAFMRDEFSGGIVGQWPKTGPQGKWDKSRRFTKKEMTKIYSQAQYNDPLWLVTRTKAEGIYTCGGHDPFSPLGSVIATYNNHSGKKTFYFERTYGHTSTASQVYDRQVNEHLIKHSPSWDKNTKTFSAQHMRSGFLTLDIKTRRQTKSRGILSAPAQRD